MSEVDGQSFKNILACWAAGITVASVASNDDWQAITVNSFASVSMVPPLICLNVANRLLTRDYMASERHFAISILSDQQLDLGKRFAGYFDDQLENRFDGLDCETTALGDPILPNAMAWLSCAGRRTDQFWREHHVRWQRSRRRLDRRQNSPALPQPPLGYIPGDRRQMSHGRVSPRSNRPPRRPRPRCPLDCATGLAQLPSCSQCRERTSCGVC